jgi:hypothetical protein
MLNLGVYFARSLKQQSMGRYVAPIEHIILIRYMVDSRQVRVKQKTLKLGLAASPLNTQHNKVRMKTA